MDWPVICICNKARRVSHKGRGNELKYLWTFSCSQKYYIPSNTYTGIHKGKMADDLSFMIIIYKCIQEYIYWYLAKFKGKGI